MSVPIQLLQVQRNRTNYMESVSFFQIPQRAEWGIRSNLALEACNSQANQRQKLNICIWGKGVMEMSQRHRLRKLSEHYKLSELVLTPGVCMFLSRSCHLSSQVIFLGNMIILWVAENSQVNGTKVRGVIEMVQQVKSMFWSSSRPRSEHSDGNNLGVQQLKHTHCFNMQSTYLLSLIFLSCLP